MSDYAKKTVADLTEILKSRGLSHSGKKAELVARLQESDKSAEKDVTEPEAVTESGPPPVAAPSEPAPSAPAPTAASSEAAKPSETAVEPTAPSPDTALAATTNYALNLPTESLDDEAARRKKRAERFGISAPANGAADDEEARKAERAKKFGAVETEGLGKLNVALPSERERGPKRRKEGEDTTMDDPALIRRGGGGRGGGRGGFRGRFRGSRGPPRGGRRSGTPDRPSGVQKPVAFVSDKDRAAADARKKRFAAAN